jgi:hypothetical protein
MLYRVLQENDTKFHRHSSIDTTSRQTQQSSDPAHSLNALATKESEKVTGHTQYRHPV